MRSLFLIFALFLGLTGWAMAQSYPVYREVHVNDFADLLPSVDEARIRGKLQELRQETGVEFTLVTIESMRDYGHSGPIEPFATGLFNHWGVGDASRNDGVMMLIAQVDRVMRIEVGSGYGHDKDAAMKDIIDDEIIPRFKRQDFVTGIERGVDAVIFNLTGHWPGEFDAGAPEKLAGGLRRLLDRVGNWLISIIAAVFGGALFLHGRWKRYRPRICPRDGQTMQRLDEEWDDNHLQKGQIAEEKLKSVDYDVWQCPQCDHVTVEGYRSWFSRHIACGSCGYRTVEGDTTILQHATTSSTGLKRIDYHCLNCDDRWSVNRIIFKKSRGSSTSGSFGGGSSSGGGASGSW